MCDKQGNKTCDHPTELCIGCKECGHQINNPECFCHPRLLQPCHMCNGHGCHVCDDFGMIPQYDLELPYVIYHNTGS